MAGLGLNPGAARISARSQFSAVAWLRWRLFVNSFRRKGTTSELLARVVMVPVLAVIVIGPIVAGGGAAWYAISHNRTHLLSPIFWAIFAFQVVISINIAQPGLSFEPEQLVRFPLSFPRYLLIRLVLGLLSTSTVIGSLALIAAAGGATFARPALGPVLFAAALALALTNMLFIRMIFAWVDRWLSTRRAREIFTGLIILFSVGIQYLNVTFNPGFSGSSGIKRAAKEAVVKHIYYSATPFLRLFPPGYAAAAVGDQVGGHSLLAALNVVGILVFAAFFLAVFAWRMRLEFAGENLSEVAANQSAPSLPTARVSASLVASYPPARLAPDSAAKYGRPIEAAPLFPSRSLLGVSPAIAACLLKEWIYLRRNTAQFYAVLTPLAMVLLFASRMGRFSHTGYTFPAAAAYSVLGLCALSYNLFGLDATGIQFYFLAPVDFRSIIVAKNLFGFFFLGLDVVLVYVAIFFISGRPPLLITAITLAWLVFAALINATVGNIRSITTPKKMDPGKISRKQASQMSALLAVGLMLLAAAAGIALIFLGRSLRRDWLPLPAFLVLAAIAVGFYLIGLTRVDHLMARHRESMLEELTKTS